MAKRPPEETKQSVSLEQRLEKLALRELEMSDLERWGYEKKNWGSHDSNGCLDVPWRDHGDSASLDRVWRRLDGSLRQAARYKRQRPFVAMSAAAAIFALGVFAGRITGDDPAQLAELPPEQLLAPEPFLRAEERSDARDRTNRPSAAPVASPRRTTPLGRPELRRSTPTRNIQPKQEEAPVIEVEPSPIVPTVRALPELPRWLVLADRGEYAAAFQAVDQVGGFDAVLTQANAEELMTLADVARAAGQQGRAIQALRRVIQLYPDDPNAPVAAMMLGNLLHRAGDVVGAAEAYALNRSLSPQGDFAEDALAREFEVALEALDLERARALATQYEREFPQGRRLGEVREQLARVEREAGEGEHQREGATREGTNRDAANRDAARLEGGAPRDTAGREGTESRPGERVAPRE